MADIDLCPRCQAPLKFNGAKSCDCGWRKRERPAERQQAPYVPKPCCYEGCPRDATVKIETKTGWADMCKGHHEAYTLAQAKAYTAGLGLKTQLDLRRFCKTNEMGKGRMHGAFLKAYKGSAPMIDRQPGQDDEEAAA